MEVRAKMKVMSITKSGDAKKPYVQVKLGAVYSNDPQSENRSFANATPSGELSLNIDAGRPAATAFELQGEYYVDITPVGVPERFYLGDFLQIPGGALVLESRDKTKSQKAEYDPSRSCFKVGGVEQRNDKLMAEGFEFWRHPKDGE
jgi:hypothetical protein